MNKFIIALLSFLFTSSALRADVLTGTHLYVEPSVVYASLGKDFKESSGGALAIGVSFARHHAIEVEMINFKTESKENISTDLFGHEAKLALTPVLGTYKYAFLIGKNLRLLVGISVGVTIEKYDYTAGVGYYGYPYYNSYTFVTTSAYSRTYYPFTIGGDFGVAYTFTKHVSATAGVKVLGMNETYVTTRGIFTTVQLGLRYTF